MFVRCNAKGCLDKKSIQLYEDDQNMGEMCLSTSACSRQERRGRRSVRLESRSRRFRYRSLLHTDE